ncbi:hypothetical protein IGI42_003240 [Enterococcus sp. AZ109]
MKKKLLMDMNLFAVFIIVGLMNGLISDGMYNRR